MKQTNVSTPAPSASGPAYKVNVLERAVAILQVFSLERPSLSLADISRMTGIHRSTVLRLLSTLCHAGLMLRDEDTGQYSLGYELIAMAEIARAGTGVSEWARPVMRTMREELNETVVLSVRSGDNRVDVEQVVGNQAIRRVVALGEHKPLTIGAPSLAILSQLPQDEIDAIVDRLMDLTLSRMPDFDRDELMQKLDQLRKNGFHEHMSHYGPDGKPGSAGIAAPVLGRRGEVVASIGVSVPIGRFGSEERAKIIEVVKRGAAETSGRLGNRSPSAA